uniref:Rho GTPase activating protein 27 n=1 Tax=Sphenodon punctatus TaxID=8508 RepID=A0A8D0L7Y9_SPHPU
MSNRVPQVLRRCKLRASRLLSTSQASEERPPDPVYVNLQEVRQEAEATSSSPLTEPLPSSPLSDWETHTDADSGQPFYYNPVTGQTTWDCPFDAPVEAVSPTTSPSPSLGEWSQYLDEASGQLFFYNSVTGQTSWEPPQEEDIFGSQEMQPGIMSYSLTDQRPPTPEADYPEPSPDELPDSFPEEDYSPISSPPLWHCEGQGWGCHHSQEGPYADVCASNTISVPSHHRSASSGSSHDGSPFSPRHNSITMFSAQQEEQWKTLDKAGVLHRTKTIDKGKRLRKNWSSSWTVLEGGILTFFKDSKHSSSSSSSVKHPSMPSTPEHTVDLRGAALAWAAKDKSSRKNVLELKTRDGSKYLIQHDSEMIINTWHNAIADSISRLVRGISRGIGHWWGLEQ